MQYQDRTTEHASTESNAFYEGKGLFKTIIVIAVVAEIIAGRIIGSAGKVIGGRIVVYHISGGSQGSLLGGILRLAVLIIPAYFLSKGQRWAKWFLGILLLVWAFSLVIRILEMKFSGNIIFLVAIAVFYGLAGAAILCSRKIKAYIEG